jgi:hypothetical protein
MNYFYCGVIAVRGLVDELGNPCGRSARTLCWDCGTSLCSQHAERCSLCGETFCQSCLSFHQSEHIKPVQSDQTTALPREKPA